MTTPSEFFDQNACQKFERAIASKYPIIYVVSSEEERIESILDVVSNSHYQDQREVVSWTASQGFQGANEDHIELTNPVNALNHIIEQDSDSFYLLKDLPGFFERDHRIERVLRDLYTNLLDKNSFVVISYPFLQLPEILKKEVYVIELDLPTHEDIAQYLTKLLKSRGLPDASVTRIVTKGAAGLRGLSFNEIKHLFSRILATEKLTIPAIQREIYEEKSQVLKKESCLIVVPTDFGVDSIGGLENLKKWVEVRGKLFTNEAQKANISPPSGVLFMGVSGCGKSLAAKAIASAWNLPLIRIDMSLIMSGAYGAPEFSFNRAIKIAENIAPLVLWIDEIENSFGYDEEGGSRSNVNIFSTFLTWMQEKPSNVFVAATANRIQAVPAEMIRKGRFDQVFYVDLPTEGERKDIFAIHVEKIGTFVSDSELDVLITMTDGWSGAEIEQAVSAARVDAFNNNRCCVYRDIMFNVGKNVPLSKTMREQVEALRSWANGRTIPASSNEITRQKHHMADRTARRIKKEEERAKEDLGGESPSSI